MPRKPALSVVTDETAPAPEPALSVSEAAESGTHRQLLVALRNRVATQVADVLCPPRDLAALTRRLQEIAKEIEAIDAADRQEAAENDEAPDEEWGEAAI